MFIYILI